MGVTAHPRRDWRDVFFSFLFLFFPKLNGSNALRHLQAERRAPLVTGHVKSGDLKAASKTRGDSTLTGAERRLVSESERSGLGYSRRSGHSADLTVLLPARARVH